MKEVVGSSRHQSQYSPPIFFSIYIVRKNIHSFPKHSKPHFSRGSHVTLILFSPSMNQWGTYSNDPTKIT